jgi:hypothetical protein
MCIIIHVGTGAEGKGCLIRIYVFDFILLFILMTREEILAKKKLYREAHAAEIQAYRDIHRDEILAQRQAYREANHQKILARRRRWDDVHKVEIQAYRRTRRAWKNMREKQRLATDINFCLRKRLRQRLRAALKQGAKKGSAVKDLGCSIGQFKKHIETKFLMGMSWDNRNKWHLDHIIPLSKFDLTDRQQFLIAVNYTNYQPLWAKDNIAKHNLHIMDFRDGMF